MDNIRVIITSKADIALDDLAKKFNLEEDLEESIKRSAGNKLSKAVSVSLFAKDFAKGIISEKSLIDSLQKDLEVSPQTAEQISKEIISKVVPLLEKIPEGNFKKPDYRESISKNIFGVPLEDRTREINKESSENITETPAGKLKSKSVLPPKKIKNPIIPEEIDKPAPQARQLRGPDNYREPIE